MGYYAGIDVGSTSTELVVVDENSDVVAFAKEPTSGDVQKAVQNAISVVEQKGIGLNDFDMVVSTGYGRKYVECASKNITEITCYAKGVGKLFPDARTIIDIGGQDSKVISLAEKGVVKKFLMNDKCAAGTGKFLELIGRIFDKDLCELGELSMNAKEKITISSMCAVFAESEIISLISKGKRIEDIIASAHRAVCERVVNLLKRVGIENKIVFCGGVAKNVGMINTFKELLQQDIYTPDNVFIVGAVGAALFALES
jgi:predicted CoA-substrate-specific enzyme activase